MMVSIRSSILLALLALIIAGCRTPSPFADTSPKTLRFDGGSPIVDVEAYPIRTEDGPRLEVVWGVVPLSLITLATDAGTYRAIARTELTITSADEGAVAVSQSSVDTLVVESPTAHEYRLYRDTLDLGAGDYTLKLEVRDGTTGAFGRRTIDVSVPDAGAAPQCVLTLSRGEPRRPVVGYHVTMSDDWIELRASGWGRPATYAVSVVRIDSDTSVAGPPYGLGRTRVALSVRGVAAERPDTLEARRWHSGQEAQDQLLRFTPPQTGIYVASCEHEGEVLARREFAVRQAGFPAVDRLDVMVEALEYLATARELRHLRNSDDAIELKHRFDAFWMARAPDRATASRLLEQYYSRVEEANRLFSGVKEGWKTDRGMIYILRGPPLFIDRFLDHEQWYYSYSEMNPADVYRFERVIVPDLQAINRNVVLERSRVYDYEWRRLVGRWRDASIL